MHESVVVAVNQILDSPGTNGASIESGTTAVSKKNKHQKYGYRTQWKGRNLFMVTIVWGTHALPLYWELLNHQGNSSLATQKRLLKIALKLLKPYPVLVIGDREFHSPKLAQ